MCVLFFQTVPNTLFLLQITHVLYRPIPVAATGQADCSSNPPNLYPTGKSFRISAKAKLFELRLYSVSVPPFWASVLNLAIIVPFSIPLPSYF